MRTFLKHFLSGDTDTARSMVRSDFTFRAPLVEAGSKDDFFAGAEAKAGLIRGYRLLRQWHDKDEVSTLYEVDVRTSRGQASALLHEWHTVSSGRLAASVMVFDTASRAAQLMHEALKDIDGWPLGGHVMGGDARDEAGPTPSF